MKNRENWTSQKLNVSSKLIGMIIEHDQNWSISQHWRAVQYRTYRIIGPGEEAFIDLNKIITLGGDDQTFVPYRFSCSQWEKPLNISHYKRWLTGKMSVYIRIRESWGNKFKTRGPRSPGSLTWVYRPKVKHLTLKSEWPLTKVTEWPWPLILTQLHSPI